MIRKLRHKMILASMLSLLFVLAVILSVAGVLNYQKIVTDANKVLTILVENDGKFPMMEPPGNGSLLDDKHRKGDRRFSAELPYESRYFSVFFAADESVISVNTGKIAAENTQTAVEYARAAIRAGKERGFSDDYRYAVYAVGEETHIVFLDCGREMSSFRSFLFTSGAVSAVGLAAVLLLLFFLSARIVKPFSENYEKQKQFITDAGHELKTPLTIIDADAEVLEMDIGENEWLNDIQTQTKRLTELTNSLIQLSRIEEQPQIEKDRVSAFGSGGGNAGELSDACENAKQAAFRPYSAHAFHERRSKSHSSADVDTYGQCRKIFRRRRQDRIYPGKAEKRNTPQRIQHGGIRCQREPAAFV